MTTARIIRPVSENSWNVLIDDQLIGLIKRSIEPGLNDRGPRTVIRGYDLNGRNATIIANDIKHAACMLANRHAYGDRPRFSAIEPPPARSPR